MKNNIEKVVTDRGFIFSEELSNHRKIFISKIKYERGEGEYCLYYNAVQNWLLVWVGDIKLGVFSLWNSDEVHISGSTLFAGKIETEQDIKNIFKYLGL